MSTSTPSSSDNSTQMSTQAIHAFHRCPPTSSVLWAHILRKDTVSSTPSSGLPHVSSSNGSDVPIPPLTPQDKNGTSTRILLHDTQANLQKFGERVEKLTSIVDDAKQEIAVVKKLFRDEHENMMSDILDLVNRSQTEIQKPMGKPAQAEKMDQLQRNIELRLESLDKRIDAIQIINQTTSQTLQTQAQAIQTIQNQQGTILTALTPLLPLLQAVPLHIESARNTINESLSASLKSVRIASTPLQKSNVAGIPRTFSKRLRNQERTTSPESSEWKRRRIGENDASMAGQQNRHESTISSNPILSTHLRQNVSPISRKTSIMSSRPQHSSVKSKSSMLLASLGQKMSGKGPVTPRRPLAELPLATYTREFACNQDTITHAYSVPQTDSPFGAAPMTPSGLDTCHAIGERSPTASVVDVQVHDQADFVIPGQSSPVLSQRSPELRLPSSTDAPALEHNADPNRHNNSTQQNHHFSSTAHTDMYKFHFPRPMLKVNTTSSSSILSPAVQIAASNRDATASFSRHCVSNPPATSETTDTAVIASTRQLTNSTPMRIHSAQSHISTPAPTHNATSSASNFVPEAKGQQPATTTAPTTLTNDTNRRIHATPITQRRGPWPGPGNTPMAVPRSGAGPSRRRRSPFREGRRFIPLDDSDDSEEE
ncbi:hypothetical protein VKT23_005061 [Stygiomarasmius scandens]|uniref:Uncharacterized protein n=1 Tax=Marasmiellus scandens TaxID=2682957 RepID=A0ABR1JXW3_9AGAR